MVPYSVVVHVSDDELRKVIEVFSQLQSDGDEGSYSHLGTERESASPRICPSTCMKPWDQNQYGDVNGVTYLPITTWAISNYGQKRSVGKH